MPVKALAPAIAAPALTPSGYIELYAGGDQYNFFGDERDNAWTLGGAGRANWWLEEAKAAAARVLELQPAFRYSRQLAGVDCAPALAASLSEALRAAGLPE